MLESPCKIANKVNNKYSANPDPVRYRTHYIEDQGPPHNYDCEERLSAMLLFLLRFGTY